MMKPLDPVLTADDNGLIVYAIGEEVVWVLSMIYNDRIVIGPRESGFYEHGWCYDKGGSAVLAALAWDPRTQDEPEGYKKRATPGHRARRAMSTLNADIANHKAGETCNIVRELNDTERDVEVGVMYLVNFNDGSSAHVFADEISV